MRFNYSLSVTRVKSKFFVVAGLKMHSNDISLDRTLFTVQYKQAPVSPSDHKIVFQFETIKGMQFIISLGQSQLYLHIFMFYYYILKISYRTHISLWMHMSNQESDQARYWKVHKLLHTESELFYFIILLYFTAIT